MNTSVNMSVETQYQPYFVDRAKAGRAACKGCKDKCATGELRIAKLVPSPYGDGQQMKSWYHVDCLMNVLLKQRPATKRIDSIDDIGNWETLSEQDQNLILDKINETEKLFAEKHSGKYTAKIIKNQRKAVTQPDQVTSLKGETTSPSKLIPVASCDNKFSEFTNLCNKIASVSAYTAKTSIVNTFFTKGADGKSFSGDLALWCKLLLPQVTKRVYNLKSKQLIKLFSKIFNTDQDAMLTHLERGDVSETISYYFNKYVQPSTNSPLTIHDVDSFLNDLSKLTKEDEQINHFIRIIKKCTVDDLKTIIRLIKADLRINAGPKHILEGVHPDAYSVFQTSQDLDMVLNRVLPHSSGVRHKDALHKNVHAKLSIMTPVLPMLAEACKSVDMAMKKCPNGMFSEIKYDGERVQVHKKGKEFKYFSRALKPVMPHKVSHFKDYLPQAFPAGKDLVLDAEVLMIDVKTGKPLPFGTLGIHKQSEFKDAQVCLFVFDCLYYNGEVLMDLPIRERRKILLEHMTEVQNHVMFSEQKLIKKSADLADMIAKVLKLGLEGLVLKDLESKYEPGKRHWLKVKKDYLFEGAMADTADLVVLGAWFGLISIYRTMKWAHTDLVLEYVTSCTFNGERECSIENGERSGKKGGMMSVFLMGCFDTNNNCWVTVTKVHTGHDDYTLEKLQNELLPLMTKISRDSTKLPIWLKCNNSLVPDFVAKDPKNQPVWEITGTEFTKANVHTADGISIRFPRVTRIRSDKNWESATNLDELKQLFKTSKEKTDVSLLNKLAKTAESDDVPSDEPPKKKFKESPSKVKTIESFFNKSPKSNKSKSDDLNTSQSSNSSFGKSPNQNESKKKKMKVANHDSHSIKRLKGGNVNTSQSSESSANGSPTRTESRKEYLNDSSSRTSVKSYQASLDVKTIKKSSIKLLPDNPLPDVFQGCKLGFYPDFISFAEEERRLFERHWIAYGGETVKSVHAKDIDFVLHNSSEIKFSNMVKLKAKLPPHVKHITKFWLIQCVNDKELCDTAKYAVTVFP